MSDLMNEIMRELNLRGVECLGEKIRGVQCIACRAGKEWRVVLPVEVCAATVEEARLRAVGLRRLSAEREWGLSGGDLALGTPILVPEDVFRSRRGMMMGRVLAHLGLHHRVYARNCEVRRIDRSVTAEFLERCHTYGDAKCRYCYGLYLKRYTGKAASQDVCSEVKNSLQERIGARPEPGALVAVAEFSNARRWKKSVEVRSYEWVRYASLPNLRVCGGMGRVLQQFIEDVKPDDIMTYADLEWSEGGVYSALGFAEEGEKEAVDFVMENWRRRAIGKVRGMAELCENNRSGDGVCYYTNFGSKKYRLKLIDYE